MCLYPKLAYVSKSSGKVCFSVNGDYRGKYDLLYLPCGKCLECLEQKSIEWTYRVLDECKNHKDFCFITLTYADNPVDLVSRDLQLFIKRLRRRISPLKIRYFACGEYGGKRGRPHYHCIIFGWKPDDLIPFFKDKNGYCIYRSLFLEKVWGLGYVSVGDVTDYSIKYCCKYLQKLDKRYHKVAPFLRMSNRPGIGADGFDMTTAAFVGKTYYNGKECVIPRYYMTLLERQGLDVTELKKQRVKVVRVRKIDYNALKVKRAELKQRFGVLRVKPKKP